MSAPTKRTTTGKVVAFQTGAFGRILTETGEVREFDWADVVQAGTFVTYGIRGTRCFVVLEDETRIQVSRSYLGKIDRKTLDALIVGAWVSNYPRGTTQAVKLGDRKPEVA